MKIKTILLPFIFMELGFCSNQFEICKDLCNNNDCQNICSTSSAPSKQFTCSERITAQNYCSKRNKIQCTPRSNDSSCQSTYQKVYYQRQKCLQDCINNFIGIPFFLSLLGLSIILACLPCIFPILCCKTSAKLKRVLNVVDTSQCKILEYNKRKQYILNLLNSKTSNYTFSFYCKAKQYKVQSKAEVVKAKPFKTRVRVLGEDELGAWASQGYIVSRKQGTIFWMFKQYKDKRKAGQIGKNSVLIFQSQPITVNQDIFGYWYYVGREKNENFTGHWKINKSQQNQSSSGSQKRLILNQSL